MAARKNVYWLLAALLFGVLALPFFVHFTGIRVLGDYAGGGTGAFYGDFLRDLAALRWHSWTLALGPLLVVAIWRGLWRFGTGSPRR
jgi:thiamine transporter ThiT